MKTKTRTNYHDYINSDKWRDRHDDWLKAVDHRCSMLPWLRLGKAKGRYHPYSIHHLHYRNLGNERLGRDVMPLSKFAHDWIIHGILSGFKSAGKQKDYPNTAQRIVHFWCIQRVWVKNCVLIALAVMVVLSFLRGI